jgi:hypothetical protein
MLRFLKLMKRADPGRGNHRWAGGPKVWLAPAYRNSDVEVLKLMKRADLGRRNHRWARGREGWLAPDLLVMPEACEERGQPFLTCDPSEGAVGCSSRQADGVPEQDAAA